LTPKATTLDPELVRDLTSRLTLQCLGTQLEVLMPELDSQAASHTYAQLLLTKKLGFPLWYPELSTNLPRAYLQKGISIGDVGIITPDGSFDFLFNICEKADDPVNGNDVPPGFAQVRVGRREKDTFPNMYGPGAVICSASVQKSSIKAEVSSQDNPYDQPFVHKCLADQLHRAFPVGIGAGFDFSCTCEKGAILVLPDGAFREDLRRLEKFRHAAEHNAMAWYGHARNCGLNPESLYLVTGCVKTSSWGVASISNASEERSACLKFTAASVAQASASYSYSWETYSPADVRNGPKPASEVKNQCVFLRGFKISFNENLKTLWSRKINFEINC